MFVHLSTDWFLSCGGQAVEDTGMDFWWIDWQQGETGGNTGQDGPRHKVPTVVMVVNLCELCGLTHCPILPVTICA